MASGFVNSIAVSLCWTQTAFDEVNMLAPEQTTLFGESLKPHKLPQTQYLGSKQRLVKWIFKCAPDDVETVFDAFSGTSSVGYHFKTQGKRVITNDFLMFNYHVGKAVIENKDVTLSREDVDLLMRKNGNADSLIRETFTGVFFERDQAEFLDNFRANVDLLDGDYKRSLAFTIMSRALTRKVLLGHFAHLKALEYSRTPERVKRNPTIARSLKDLFVELANEYNDAIFDNEKENEVHCENTIGLIKQLRNVDLVYFDPPYCGCHPDYQAFYHFLETFVEYWRDKKFINSTKQYYPKKESGFVQKKEILGSFKNLFENSSHIPYWLISYNSKSYPDRKALEDLIKQYKKVELFEHEYQNHYGGRGSRKGTREYLFLCHG